MDKTLGLYIHIPFCASKCGYCDFYSVAGCDSLMPKYQNALLEHIREASPRMSPYYIDTLYLGGGDVTVRKQGNLLKTALYYAGTKRASLKLATFTTREVTALGG